MKKRMKRSAEVVRSAGGGKAPPLHGTVRRLGPWMVAMVAIVCSWTAPAFACPVCYGGASGSMIDGAKLSVIFLGALVYLVIGGGVAMFVVLRRRAIKNQDPRRGLHAVPRSNET